MRCASCSLPLSPARTHCPGCGAANPEMPGRPHEHTTKRGEVPQYAFPSPQNGNGFSAMQVNNHMQTPSIGAREVQQTASAQQMVYQSVGSDIPPFPDAGQLWLPDGPPNGPAPDWSPASQTRPTAQANAGGPPRRPKLTNGRSSARLNFTISGLCVLTGGLILIFVYIISFSLPPASISSQQIAIATATAVGFSPTSQGPATNATATMQPTPAITPTMSLPGQQYIDTARMASSVNTATAQPIQLTNRFKIKQPIFVTFTLHPQNTGGAVCLLWYLNQKPFSHYAFSVYTTTQSAYSYAYAGSPGAGSVEIYWASTTACADKALAQVVKFTVNL